MLANDDDVANHRFAVYVLAPTRKWSIAGAILQQATAEGTVMGGSGAVRNPSRKPRHCLTLLHPARDEVEVLVITAGRAENR